MAQLGQTFDASTVDPNGGFPLVAPGKYLAQIVNSEMKVTKDGMGQYLQIEIEIMDGPEAGKKVFDRLNLQNNNPTTVAIAQRTLSQICHATGMLSVNDSEQLHARRMLIDVRIEQGKGQYRDQNRILSYMPPDGGAIQSAAPAARVETPPMQRAVGATPPWRSRS